MSWTQFLSDHLLTTTLAFAAVWLATRFIKRPLVRHLLWGAVLLKFLIPPLMPLTISWPVDRPENTQITASRFAPPPAVLANQPPPGDNLLPSPVQAKPTDIPVPPATKQTPVTHAEPTWSWPTTDQLTTGLLVAWVAGSILVLLIALARAWRFQRLLRRTATNDSQLQAEVNELAHRCRLKQPPTVLLTRAAVSPMLWAIIRPRLVFPQELLASLSDQQRQTLLLHELAHLARRDHWLRRLEFLATTLWWWHPAIWLARRELHTAEEECCDGWVVAQNHTARRQYADALLATLDFLADPHPALPPVACGMGRITRLERRLTMILHRPVDHLCRFTRIVIGCAIAALLGGSLALAEDNPSVPQTPSAKESTKADSPESKNEYFVTGQLTDAKTGEPIAGAKVHVLIDTDRNKVPIGENVMRSGLTDQKGRYRIAVPVGDGRIWGLLLPPGYWATHQTKFQNFRTTRHQPIARVDLEANRGPVLNIKVSTQDETQSLEQLRASSITMKPKPDPSVGHTTTIAHFNEQGLAKIVLPPGGTEYQLGIGQRSPLVRESITITCENGFRLDHARKVVGSDGKIVTDKKGRTMLTSDGTLSVRDGRVTLAIDVKPLTLPTRTVTGRVINTNREPIPGVRIGVSKSTVGGGGSAALVSTTTTQNGEFEFEIELFLQMEALAGKDRLIGLALTKDGYASIDTERLPLIKGDEPIDFGTITLKPGHSIKVRVTNQAGEPVVGATVEPGNSYAVRRQITRTDKSGIALLENLPLGELNISARWGELYEHTHAFVTMDDNNVIKVQLAPRIEPTPEAFVAARNVEPIPVGAPAPELTVTGWSDGKNRALSDYRGKIVVLDFWGIWCSACRFSMPAKKRVATKFADDEVVFLGIHTAGDNMSQVKNALKSFDLGFPSAIDQGKNTITSKTALAYGVRGYPTTIIIGRDGKVVFNSGSKVGTIDSAEEMMKIMTKT